ncbi:MAG: AMIN domain-containing protein, partial [Deltaproteobacteria bacterium]|nr:AMIN domain-containing protein [Deltaproteobacteria bacterium]
KEGVALAEEVRGISEPSIIREIEVAKQENVSVITIKASKPLTYTVVKLKDPLRIVVDVPDFTTEGAIETLEVNSNVIKRINNKQMEKGERTFCRIEIGLNIDAEYKVVPERNDLVISVAGPSELVAVGEKAVEKGIAEEVPERKSIEVKKIIDLKISKDHNRMTVVSDSEMIDYNAFTIENPYRLVVDIPDAEKHFSKNIFTFKSPFLDKIKIGQHQKKVRFVVYFQDRLPTYRIEKDDNKLSVIWEMPAVAEKEKKVEEVIAEKGAVEEEKVKEVAAQEIPLKEEEKEDLVKKEKEISEEPQIVSAAREGKLEGEKVYTGRKISLDFKDADIRNIIRLIADIS